MVKKIVEDKVFVFHTVKGNGAVQVQLNMFLTTELDVREVSVSRSARFTAGKTPYIPTE